MHLAEALDRRVAREALHGRRPNVRTRRYGSEGQAEKDEDNAVKITQDEHQVANAIDLALRSGDFQHVPLTEYGDGYQRWYAKLLTTLTLTIGSKPLVYAQARHRAGESTAQLLLVTERSVVVIDVTGIGSDSAAAVTRLIGRRSLTSLGVQASMAIDQDGSSAYAWPGLVEVTATYAPLDDALVFADTGYTRGHSEARGPILELLAGLQLDLDGATA